MKINLHKIVEQFKKNNIFIFIGVLLILLSSVITITQGFSVIKDQYEKSIGYKGKLLSDIDRLSADVYIGYFTNILGSPVFVNDYNDRVYIPKDVINTNLTEYIFVNKYFFVQALVDKQSKVIAYSVTTREANFNPELKDIKLGKTKFKEIEQGESESISSRLGPHDFYYHEAYYEGNPGNYQTVIYTLNEAGYAGIEDEQESYMVFPPLKKNDEKINFSDPEIQKFRNDAIVNTYTVSAPMVFFEENLDGFSFGPDYNQTRILPKE